VLRTSTGATDATSIAWSRDDSRLSTLGADGEARVIDPASGQVVASFRAQPGRCSSSSVRLHAFVADDARIVVAVGCEAGELWEWAEPKLVARLASDFEARAFASSRSGRLIAIADSLGVVHAWDAVTGEKTGWCLNVAVATKVPGFVALEFSPDDTQLAIGCGDGVVRLVPLHGPWTARELGTPTWPFLPDSVGSVRYSVDGSRLVATLFPWHDQRLFDVATGAMISTHDRGGGFDAPIDAWFSRDGERIVCSSAREVRDGHDLSRLLSRDVHYASGGYRSDGEHVWAVTGGMLRIFRVLDGATVLEFPIRTAFDSRAARGT